MRSLQMDLQIVDVRHVEDQIDVIKYHHRIMPQQLDGLSAVQEQNTFHENEDELHENCHDIDGRQTILQNELAMIILVN